MKMRAKKISLVQFRLDCMKKKFDTNQIRITMNEAFVLHNKKLAVNTTPNSNATLHTIQNIVIDGTSLEFAYTKKINTYRSRLDLSSHPMAPILAKLIYTINQDNCFELDSKNDKIVITSDLNFEFTSGEGEYIAAVHDRIFSLLMERADHTSQISIDFSDRHGQHITIIAPEPWKRCVLTGCEIEDNKLCVTAFDEDGSQLSYEWFLNLQPNLLYVVGNLISAGISLMVEKQY